jgi:RNA polymerase sigma-70 factor (ECF subfamily)
LHKIWESFKISTWIYRITINASIDFLRRKKKKVSFKEEIASDSKDRDKEKEEILKEAISKLPLRQKNVIVLKHFEGLKIKEISKILNCSQSSVKTHILRGIRNLKRILKDYEKEMY